MALSDRDVARLFEIVCQTIEAEDKRLHAVMHQKAHADPHGCYAGRYPPGLSTYLYEQGIAFLVFRELLEDQDSPFEFVCEHEYPNGKGTPSEKNRMDLGILERNPGGNLSLVGAVEVKWWKGDPQVREDISKLRRLSGDVRKFVLLLGTWQDATFQSIAGEVRQKFEIDLIEERSHLFHIYGMPLPKRNHYSHFYVLLLEV